MPCESAVATHKGAEQCDTQLDNEWEHVAAQSVSLLQAKHELVKAFEPLDPPKIKLEKVFYINLDSQTVRKETLEGQLQNKSGDAELVYERFSALSPANVNDMPKQWWANGINLNKTIFKPKFSAEGFVTLPQEMKSNQAYLHHLGCHMSHHVLWERIAHIARDDRLRAKQRRLPQGMVWRTKLLRCPKSTGRISCKPAVETEGD